MVYAKRLPIWNIPILNKVKEIYNGTSLWWIKRKSAKNQKTHCWNDFLSVIRTPTEEHYHLQIFWQFYILKKWELTHQTQKMKSLPSLLVWKYLQSHWRRSRLWLQLLETLTNSQLELWLYCRLLPTVTASVNKIPKISVVCFECSFFTSIFKSYCYLATFALLKMDISFLLQNSRYFSQKCYFNYTIVNFLLQEICYLLKKILSFKT